MIASRIDWKHDPQKLDKFHVDRHKEESKVIYLELV
jgi:hypothetical protein